MLFGSVVDAKDIAEGRNAPKSSEAGIQFDSEWLEGQTKSPILLYPRESPHAMRQPAESLILVKMPSESCKKTKNDGEKHHKNREQDGRKNTLQSSTQSKIDIQRQHECSYGDNAHYFGG